MQTSYSNSLQAARPGLQYGIGPKSVLSKVVSSKQKAVLTPSATNSATYSVVINGTTFTYTADGSATVAEITAGLVALINAGTEPVTATDGTTVLTLEADSRGVAFTLAVGGTGTLAVETQVEGAQKLPFGAFACLGLDDNSVQLPSVATDVTGGKRMGVVLAHHSMEQRLEDTSVAGAYQKDTVALMQSGMAYVLVEEAVAVGDPVYVRFKSGNGGTLKGYARNDSDTSTCALYPNARFVTASAGAGYAAVELL